MKREAALDFFVMNHQMCSTKDMSVFDRIEKRSIYEVIKIVAGVPLFFEDHLERMRRSAALLNESMPKPEEEILSEIILLVKHNCAENINVKLVWTRIEGADVFLTYFIEPEYPSRKDYARGIHTILFQGARHKPHLKTVQSSLRERITMAREHAGAYEALLTDDKGNITEGSRSNIFFLKNDHIYTPPARTVLLGVTRKHVLALCQSAGLRVREAFLHSAEIVAITGAFITGTTVDIAPIGSIDDTIIPSVDNPIIRKIRGLYAEKVTAYIEKNKSVRQIHPLDKSTR